MIPDPQFFVMYVAWSLIISKIAKCLTNTAEQPDLRLCEKEPAK